MQEMNIKPDVVTQFLLSQGLVPEAEYFGNSHVLVGQRVKLLDCELVYRLEDEELIICDFVAKQPVQGSASAVAAFIHLIHKIEKSVPTVKRVRGLFLESMTRPELNQIRMRLSKVLEAQGATWRDIDGELWLVYEIGLAQAV
ncbi:secretion protein [Chromobacterium violaceum]|uniref:Secretion system effector SseE n=1 Tax=Chromobacterium violaceum (strain ATCC 12472 / DSM 30191 / JCM 1249 / CCUG 213 / NBRC 12614 / NCIMB 9131 / NCTC 9757 / MK) TaxID=243365 RepID=Q7NUX3_CHRVO|nr:secretion protein [Chromobacterium violaceum]AAQ60244.1 secretion system effector SseE [Chromobacterium violaceum ATCC 12472]SUX35772.1 pathogenicity island 2 effector protein SseE [Chromobacterium violaceum]